MRFVFIRLTSNAQIKNAIVTNLKSTVRMMYYYIVLFITYNFMVFTNVKNSSRNFALLVYFLNYEVECRFGIVRFYLYNSNNVYLYSKWNRILLLRRDQIDFNPTIEDWLIYFWIVLVHLYTLQHQTCSSLIVTYQLLLTEVYQFHKCTRITQKLTKFASFFSSAIFPRGSIYLFLVYLWILWSHVYHSILYTPLIVCYSSLNIF